MLAQSVARHHHLCPRQVLGVRIGLAGARAVKLEVPRRDKRVNCEKCGEEIFNEREVIKEGRIMCRGCTGDALFI